MINSEDLNFNSTTQIQEIFLPTDTSIGSLYIHFISGYSEIDKDTLRMEKNAKVSFNTYFNSFYEDYWSNISCVDNLLLEVDFSGSILVEVFRDTKNHGCHKIGFLRLNSDTPDRRTIPLSALESAIGETGRIFFDITARKKSYVSGLRFMTTTPAKRQARISIGICTFNREKFLLRNLRSILGLPTLAEGLAKIVVVNQGPSFKLPALENLVQDSTRVLLVEQGNLGGCGGFTRTMHEALNLEIDTTHHVLMDDDAVIDARVLQNLLSLLAYANDDLIVGGHMLDLLRPHVLYEAGAHVKSNTRIKPLHHNIDLRAVDSLISFNKYHSVDYNAWWFCSIPVEHIRAAEFPVPIFIRGDDMEYGVRQQERGVTTVAMPGIGVWHEPFYVKVGGWQTYYDLRNRLILASSYPHRFKHESPTDVLWWMLKAAASHDYLSAFLLVKAVEDFLQGPSLFEKGADAIHTEVVALAKSLAQATVPENETPASPSKLHCMPKSDWAHGILVARRIAMTLLFANKRPATLLLDHEANLSNIKPNPYVKTNGIGSYRLRYEPDRSRLVQILVAAAGAWSAYRRQRHSAAKAWGAQIQTLRNPESWQAIFQSDSRQTSVSHSNTISKQ